MSDTILPLEGSEIPSEGEVLTGPVHALAKPPALVLWFCCKPGNSAGDQMCIRDRMTVLCPGEVSREKGQRGNSNSYLHSNIRVRKIKVDTAKSLSRARGHKVRI